MAAATVSPDTRRCSGLLRDSVGWSGTKFGRDIAMRGARTVFLDGKPLRSCSLAASALGDREVTTLEGLSGRNATTVRRAWVARDVPQCGYCPSGRVMSAVALLKEVRRPMNQRRSGHEWQFLSLRHPCPHPRRH
jgi:isoquinoline 1-oxidoreductase alpha subunit